MRLIVREERPHPGAQLRITDVDGDRITAFVINTTRGSWPTSSRTTPRELALGARCTLQSHRFASNRVSTTGVSGATTALPARGADAEPGRGRDPGPVRSAPEQHLERTRLGGVGEGVVGVEDLVELVIVRHQVLRGELALLDQLEQHRQGRGAHQPRRDDDVLDPQVLDLQLHRAAVHAGMFATVPP